MNLKILTLLTLFQVGCFASQYPEQDAGVVTGTALGAGLGAVVGNKSGSTAGGAAVGAATGAVIGGQATSNRDRVERDLSDREELIRRQQAELARQQQEFQELQRQRYYNDRLKKFEGPSTLENDENIDHRRKVYDGGEGYQGSVYSTE